MKSLFDKPTWLWAGYSGHCGDYDCQTCNRIPGWYVERFHFDSNKALIGPLTEDEAKSYGETEHDNKRKVKIISPNGSVFIFN